MPSATAFVPDLTPYFKLDGSRTITGATILNNTLNVSGLLTLGAGAAVTGSISATQDITARSLATTRTLSSYTTSYGLNAAITGAAAGAATDLSALYASATHSGAGLLSFLEGMQLYTSSTGPTTEHYGLYMSAVNSAATSRFYGLRVGSTSNNGAAISTEFIGAYVRAQLTGGSTTPVLIGVDIEVTGAGSTTTQALRARGGGASITGATLTGTSANTLVSLAQTWNTSGTPTALLVSITNTASNAASKLLDLQVASTSLFSVGITGKMDSSTDTLRLRTAKTPASAAAAGNQGDIAWDATYFYICVATNTWQRVAHATW